MATRKKRKAIAKAKPANPFDAVLGMIEAARARAIAAVNTALIDLCWNIGEHISRRTAEDGWGEATVQALADYIQKRHPGISGYSASNLWRMRQFYDTYRDRPKLAALLRELSWTHNVIILGKCKREEERDFYLRLTNKQKWTSRELERQIAGALFERSILSPPKLAAVMRELYPEAIDVFKDTYFVEFLRLSPGHSEADLHSGLIEQLKQFLIELGRDFCFIGSKYRIQVGKRDFEIDLVFFNRALNALVVFELKIDEFQPEYLGKLEFYLETLDRQLKKPHERPAIGVLLCATNDSEVVEYALSRSLSPALVAEYQTKMPDKKLLESKLHEFYALAESQARVKALEPPQLPKPTKGRKK